MKVRVETRSITGDANNILLDPIDFLRGFSVLKDDLVRPGTNTCRHCNVALRFERFVYLFIIISLVPFLFDVEILRRCTCEPLRRTVVATLWMKTMIPSRYEQRPQRNASLPLSTPLKGLIITSPAHLNAHSNKRVRCSWDCISPHRHPIVTYQSFV